MDINIAIPNYRLLKGVVVDTNLFLLLLLGSFDKIEIGRHRKLQKFTNDDFEKLITLVNKLGKELFITTNIVTEVCNHCANYNSSKNFRFFNYLKHILEAYQEKQSSILTIIGQDETAFLKFGITDASIIDLAKQEILVITDDFPLYHYLTSLHYSAFNFNQLQLL